MVTMTREKIAFVKQHEKCTTFVISLGSKQQDGTYINTNIQCMVPAKFYENINVEVEDKGSYKLTGFWSVNMYQEKTTPQFIVQGIDVAEDVPTFAKKDEDVKAPAFKAETKPTVKNAKAPW